MRLRIAISITLRLHWAFLAMSLDESTRSLIEGAAGTPQPIDVAAVTWDGLGASDLGAARRIEPRRECVESGAGVEAVTA